MDKGSTARVSAGVGCIPVIFAKVYHAKIIGVYISIGQSVTTAHWGAYRNDLRVESFSARAVVRERRELVT